MRDGEPARFVVLGLGKLGGAELNYSSDIDLIFLYDEDGRTDGPAAWSRTPSSSQRMGAEIVRLLAEHTALGLAYRVDMRLRPDGDQGALARSLDATLGYYVTRGRTWERQALIKCRPVAGDLDLGRTFLEAITPFVYRRYLGASEIAEIKALKRRIEQRTVSAGRAEFEVKTGHGGIRDVEFVVQFLQLLHGGEYPEVRSANTLACHPPARAGRLPDRRRAEHHGRHLSLPPPGRAPAPDPLRPPDARDAPRASRSCGPWRSGWATPPSGPWEDRAGPAHRFLADYRSKTELNRRILNHILHDAFLDDDGAAVDPVVDLVLDPHPTEEHIAEVLGRYPFRDRPTAYQNLMALAREDFLFLSHARCRHFLAVDRPAAAPGRGADRRPGHDPDEPREGLGVAGGEGDPLGAVQLQSARACGSTSSCARPASSSRRS